MARIKIEIPGRFAFRCSIPVRITDINYGGHVGNDSLLSILHEARMQYFRSLGYTEMEFAGTGMIMANAVIEFKGELFYGDIITASVTAGAVSSIGFDLIYKLETARPGSDGQDIVVALAQTSMICYDYSRKKISPVPEEAKQRLQQ